MAYETIPEIDVLIATGIWLDSQGWIIESISVARGQGINPYEDKQKLRVKFSEAKILHEDIIFNSSGADLTARKDSTTWKIECKGLGTGTPQTLRNNFDRTLASTVSYFDRRNDLRIGLAMPRDYAYINLIRSKIPQALREAINLWILLYNPDGNTIDSYEPSKAV